MEKILFGWLVLMLAGVTAAGAYVVIDHATRCDRFHFSAAAWRDPHAHHNEIAHRLVECHRLDGLQAQDVRERLGKPDSRHRLRKRGGVVWSYDAGVSRGYIFDSYEILEVELSDRDVVRSVRFATLDD
jgi:hypothetical protein